MSQNTARALYRELAAIGCDLHTGEIEEPAVETLPELVKRLHISSSHTRGNVVTRYRRRTLQTGPSLDTGETIDPI